MTVNRRAALKQILLVSAGAVLLPSCLHDTSKADVLLKNFSVTGNQEKTLAELTGVIIPTDATPGAKDVSAHLFILKMLDDCASSQDREKFMKGLSQLDAASVSASGKSFLDASAAQRQDLVAALELKKIPGEELNFCYSTARQLTIQAYTTSQYFLTKVKVYELVPGRYHGCVPVNAQLKSAS